MEVTVPFTFDGEEVRHGRIRLRVHYSAEVDNFTVPAKYALMLLSGDNDAWLFLKRVRGAPLLNGVKWGLLEEAAKKGIKDALLKLDGYIAYSPKGRPGFYRALGSSMRVDLIDGNFGVRFWAEEDLRRNLPYIENVYCEVKETSFSLNLRQYEDAQNQIGDFFAFVRRLANVYYKVRYARLKACFQAYFSDRSRAHRLLEEVERDVAWRAERDEFWRILRGRGVVNASHGVLLDMDDGIFYVTSDGGVFEVGYYSAEVRDAAYRIYKGGRVPKGAVEVTDPEVLKAIANRVAKVRPELAIIIAP